MPLTPGVHLLHPTVVVHVFEAEVPGPTAIVQAGIHGDEIAGVHALEELLEEGIRPTAGRLLVVPVMNPGAYRAQERAAPGGLDLNRCFPGDATATAVEHRLAARFLSLIEDEEAHLVATLHESNKRYHPDVHPSFGQTLVYGVQPCPAVFSAVVDRLNAELPDESERWNTHHFPVATSSTEVIVDRTGCLGTCVETWKGFALRRRVDMQKRVVELLLNEIGVRRC